MLIGSKGVSARCKVAPAARQPKMFFWVRSKLDRKSTRLNSSHTVIYTLSLHDALPILNLAHDADRVKRRVCQMQGRARRQATEDVFLGQVKTRSEEHTSELQSHRDLHSFPTRRSSDLESGARC